MSGEGFIREVAGGGLAIQKGKEKGAHQGGRGKSVVQKKCAGRGIVKRKTTSCESRVSQQVDQGQQKRETELTKRKKAQLGTKGQEGQGFPERKSNRKQRS